MGLLLSMRCCCCSCRVNLALLLFVAFAVMSSQGLSTINKIRPVQAPDLPQLKQVIDSTELFPSDMLDDMLAGYLEKKEECLWLTTDNAHAVAYCAPEKMTEGTWNLYLLAVHASQQGNGVGTQLLQRLEETLASQKARVLLVETSGNDEFDRTRQFYQKRGFVEEARIREFYQEGDDKIIYWKKLSPS